MTNGTDRLGELIADYEDEQGSVCVYQRGHQRFLTFGNAVEQSCLNLDRPHQLEHVYTQAMMLSLLLKPDAASALILGLGGGSLVRALQHVRPNMRIDAVEYRQAVIEAAHQHFELRDNGRLKLHYAEAETFVQSNGQQRDLLMLDLYLAEGAHPAQVDIEFLGRCKQQLADDGILMANQWCSEYRDSQLAQAALREAFDDALLYLQVQGGNTIAFAFSGALPRINPKTFYAQAQALGNQLDIPLQALARNFWRQNAQPLKIGRFAQR
jgi:spermidine synthase